MASENTTRLLAKSNGVTLAEHSRNVAEKAKELAKDLGLNEELCDVAYVAGLCHDIGKAEPRIQQHLKRKYDEAHGNITSEINEEEEKELGLMALHDEIGWAFLARNGFYYSNDDVNYGDIIINTVFWHHGLPNWRTVSEQEMFDKIGKILKEVDCESILQFCKELGIDKFFNRNHIKNVNTKTPDYVIEVCEPITFTGINYSITDNEILFLIRSCVVKADRIVSDGTAEETCEKIIQDVQCPPQYEQERFIEQLKIAETALSAKTAQINAPAGFGKTLIGTIWHIKQGGRTYWVTPRNTIAKGVYENLKTEITTLNLNVGVELYLGNKQMDNPLLNKSGNIDITVTNIDMLMTPIVNMNNAEMAYNAFSSNLVFDEYHEFAQKGNGIYAAFITIMNARNLLCNAKTLLLSATPSVHNDVWYGDTKIINNCKPSHNKIYNISVEDGLPIPLECTLTIFNAIRNVQEAQRTNIAHSSYTEEHKNICNDMLLQKYGKNDEKKHTTDKFVASPIIQAALNISFPNLSECVLSPESTMQRIGRCNRWGWEDTAKLKLFIGENQSERAAINVLYDNKLRVLWINFIKENMVGEKTLAEMYILYEQFNEQNKLELVKYYKELRSSSISALAEIKPYRMHKCSDKIIATNKPTLRSLDSKVFVLIKNEYTKKWERTSRDYKDVDSIARKYSWGEKELLKLIPMLADQGFSAYYRPKNINGKKKPSISDLEDQIKNAKINNDTLFINSRHWETPYPIKPDVLRYFYNDVDKRGIVQIK